VIVCARNEEQNIDRCIESLSNLDYPALELIIVDDNSDDATSEKLSAWKQRLPHLRIVDLHGQPRAAQGKVGALIRGIDAATGNIICITDADCVVNPNWVSNYVQWYDDSTGMVSSLTVLDSNTLFGAAQSCEMIQLLSMSMAAINHGVPVSIIGNNLSFRKSAYEEIGGYRNIPFSVTEDIALFQAMWHSGWKVTFKANEDLLVLSQPPGSFHTWWRQKQRWVVGGKSIGGPGWVILLLGYLGIGILTIAVSCGIISQILIILAIKITADLLILAPVAGSIAKPKLLLFFPVYEIYLTFFLLCVPIMYFQKTVSWKGRDYQT
jgi:cellulose synthase/poly-beta-1,6-N-acetylglucosamine synthase-like glycosyltransferase